MDDRTYHRIYHQKWYAEHKEEQRARSQLYHCNHRASENERNAIWGRQLKLEVFSHYSNGEPKCIVCGEKNLARLVLDHINGDGKDHHIANKYGYGTGMWSWARKNKFPPIFQLLCRDCNLLKGFPREKVIKFAKLLVEKSLSGEELHVSRKQLSEKLSITQEMWNTAKATSDTRVLTNEDKEVLERYEYVGNTLAYANGQIKLLKELLEASGKDEK